MKPSALNTFIAIVSITLLGCQGPMGELIRNEPASSAPKNLESMGWVTGLHTHFIKGTDFEFRLIEMDGSATVAMNPIYLYLVVTNNSWGPDDQTRMVSLPKVSEIKRVRFDDKHHRVIIEAMLDSMNEDGSCTAQKAATVVATASIKQGQLSERVDVAVYAHDW